MAATNYIKQVLGKDAKFFIASPEKIEGFLSQTSISITSLSQHQISEAEAESDVGVGGQEDWSQSESQVAQTLNSLIEYARRQKASDIHVEPLAKRVRVRLRIDGVLKELSQGHGQIAKDVHTRLITRIKILANLRTDQTRAAQDGQFELALKNNDKMSLRVAICPVVNGEKATLRLLQQSSLNLDLADMGYMGKTRKLLEEAIGYPDGIVLTSGPTGSGKTTSMYSLVSKIDREKLNIITLENPVEYQIDGLNQIEVNEAAGLTFSSGLRSILRSDPDTILVGEIRDSDTANLAIQAAMTGHLVFSTVHTNTAAGILPRLLNMGIEPFLIASTVRLVIGQRLVRQISPGRAVEYQTNQEETRSIQEDLAGVLPEDDMSKEEIAAIESRVGYQDLPFANEDNYSLCRPTPGISKDDDGYEGRIGIYEAFKITDNIQELINAQARPLTIEKAAISEGMVSLRQDGLLKALHGKTSLEEVKRVSFGASSQL